MAAKPSAVTISSRELQAWGFVPDPLIGKVPALRRMRRRKLLEEHVLPTLQRLEKLHLQRQPRTRRRLVGKSIGDVENCDYAIEALIYLYKFALDEGLIRIKDGKRPAPNRTGAGTTLCARNLQTEYVPKALDLMIARAPEKSRPYLEKLTGIGTLDKSELRCFRVVSHYDHRILKELKAGLKGGMRQLLRRDPAFLGILGDCHPMQFVRPLRQCLGPDFSRVLDWQPDFLKAASANLNHSAKVKALGPLLLSIDNPDVLRSLGKWPVETDGQPKAANGKKTFGGQMTTRIQQLREHLGEDFSKLMQCDPVVIEEMGRWPLKEANKVKHYFQYLSAEVLDAMESLEPTAKAQLLDGLSAKLGRSFIVLKLATAEGVETVNDIVGRYLREVRANRNSKPLDLCWQIESTNRFDDCMEGFLKRQLI